MAKTSENRYSESDIPKSPFKSDSFSDQYFSTINKYICLSDTLTEAFVFSQSVNSLLYNYQRNPSDVNLYGIDAEVDQGICVKRQIRNWRDLITIWLPKIKISSIRPSWFMAITSALNTQ